METAEQFALRVHGNQLYGDLPYDVHLRSVVQVLIDLNYDCRYQDGGWLHDTIEDTSTTKRMLARKFGPWTSMVVDACTGVGDTRIERVQSIYYKIGEFPEAAPVKVADRISNLEAADAGSIHMRRYAKERQDFDIYVARYVPMDMRRRLSQAYKY